MPILVGGFHDYLSGEKQPQEYDEYESFVAALTECVREYERNGVRVCFIAGVDMAHVGCAFGDIGKLTPQYMDGIRARDEIYLRTIVEQDKDGMLNHIAEDRDARRICGFPTMYTLLDVLDRLDLNCRGQLFDYSQAVDYQTDCAVTFAGIGLYAQQR